MLGHMVALVLLFGGPSILFILKATEHSREPGLSQPAEAWQSRGCMGWGVTLSCEHE